MWRRGAAGDFPVKRTALEGGPKLRIVTRNSDPGLADGGVGYLYEWVLQEGNQLGTAGCLDGFRFALVRRTC